MFNNFFRFFFYQLVIIIFLVTSCKKDDGPNWAKDIEKLISEPPSNPFPTDNSINQPVDAFLQWTCNVDGSIKYDVYLGQQNPPITKIAENYTSLQIKPNLTFRTQYFWQVIEKAIYDGPKTVGPVWKFTTIAGEQGPDAPILLSPLDGSSDLYTSPILKWKSSKGAVSYILQIARDSLFTDYVYDQNPGGFINTTAQVQGLDNSTTYYWRVNASSFVGTSNWSERWKFTTIPR